LRPRRDMQPGHGDSPGDRPADSQTVLATLCAWLEGHLDRPALLAGIVVLAVVAIARQLALAAGITF